MEIGVAKQFLQHAGALHEEAEVKCIGHAHAAMHLHGLLHCERGGAARTGLGDSDSLKGSSRVGVKLVKGIGNCGTGDLQIAPASACRSGNFLLARRAYRFLALGVWCLYSFLKWNQELFTTY